MSAILFRSQYCNVQWQNNVQQVGTCSILHVALAKYVKLRVAHTPGTSWAFSPPPRVSDPDVYHGTCVTHMPWCMPVSLTSGFLWNRWWGKRSRRMRKPQFHVSGKRPMNMNYYFCCWGFMIWFIVNSRNAYSRILQALCAMHERIFKDISKFDQSRTMMKCDEIRIMYIFDGCNLHLPGGHGCFKLKSYITSDYACDNILRPCHDTGSHHFIIEATRHQMWLMSCQWLNAKVT